MPGMLAHLQDTIAHRLSLYRRMMRHVGVRPSPDLPDRTKVQMRNVMLACAECADIRFCDRWLTEAHAGPPPFCRAQATLRALATRHLAEAERDTQENA